MSTNPQPQLLFSREHSIFDHLGLDRNNSKAFETEPDVAVELALSLQ
jgi:hypothetical protein